MVGTPVLLILGLYCIPVIISPGDTYAMGTSQGVSSAIEDRNFTLVPGWDAQPSFGNLRPSDMASLISHASLYCSVHAVYNDILMLVIGSWSGIEPTLATVLVITIWMLLYQRERFL